MFSKTILILFSMTQVFTFSHADPIQHIHGEKIHSHALPTIGIQHNHSNGPVGHLANPDKQQSNNIPKLPDSLKKLNFKEIEGVYKSTVLSAEYLVVNNGGAFNPAQYLVNFGYSGKELKEIGLWYAKIAKNNADYEKATWFLLSAEAQNSLSQKERLLAGKLASIVASAYLNSKNKKVDLKRQKASALYTKSGEMGIQSSYLELGYLTRFTNYKDYAKEWRYDPVVYVRYEERTFRKASECTKENTTRKLYPWTQKLCDVASKETQNADKRAQAIL